MGLAERVPGMQPGARRRNAVVGVLYALVALLVITVLLSNAGGTPDGGGTVGVGVSTATPADTPAGSSVVPFALGGLHSP